MNHKHYTISEITFNHETSQQSDVFLEAISDSFRQKIANSVMQKLLDELFHCLFLRKLLITIVLIFLTI